MGLRTELQALLEGFTDHVYFQPPENIQMQYPCIVYHRDFAEAEFADNSPYRRTLRYMVTIIDRNPDSDIPTRVADLPMCTFNRFFTADGLNHDVYTLFF
jgi:hypothetical protein